MAAVEKTATVEGNNQPLLFARISITMGLHKENNFFSRIFLLRNVFLEFELKHLAFLEWSHHLESKDLRNSHCVEPDRTHNYQDLPLTVDHTKWR